MCTNILTLLTPGGVKPRPREPREQPEKKPSFPLRQRAERLRCDTDPQRDKPLHEIAPPLSKPKLCPPAVARVARTLDEATSDQASDHTLCRRGIGGDKAAELVLRLLTDIAQLYERCILCRCDTMRTAEFGDENPGRALMRATQQMPDLSLKRVSICCSPPHTRTMSSSRQELLPHSRSQPYRPEL